eukprot:5811897-Prymnesium_polylepis.1
MPEERLLTPVMAPRDRPCGTRRTRAAWRQARRATGALVMSVDRHAPEHDGWHYQGGMHDIIGLRVWVFVFFVGPPCFQHMERDDCLEANINDMRAFWAGATV